MTLTLGGLTALLSCFKISLPGVVARSTRVRLVCGRSRIPPLRPAYILGRRLVMKKKSTTIISLPLIQEGQLSVTGERMCTKDTGKLPRRLAREQCG